MAMSRPLALVRRRNLRRTSCYFSYPGSSGSSGSSTHHPTPMTHHPNTGTAKRRQVPRLRASLVGVCCRPRSGLLPSAFDTLNVHPPCLVVNTLLRNCAAECATRASIIERHPLFQSRTSIDVVPSETYRLAIACSIWSISMVVGGICWKRNSAMACSSRRISRQTRAVS